MELEAKDYVGGDWLGGVYMRVKSAGEIGELKLEGGRYDEKQIKALFKARKLLEEARLTIVELRVKPNDQTK